jgi:uncharacterized protein (DUF1330 family)
MTAYAVAHLRHVDLGPEIVEYVRRIDATLDPYGGRFLIHGGPVDALEGTFAGDLIVIEFPNRENAREWYASPEYQAILRLRTDHAEGEAFIVEGVPDGYRAVDKLAALAPAA